MDLGRGRTFAVMLQELAPEYCFFEPDVLFSAFRNRNYAFIW